MLLVLVGLQDHTGRTFLRHGRSSAAALGLLELLVVVAVRRTGLLESAEHTSEESEVAQTSLGQVRVNTWASL